MKFHEISACLVLAIAFITSCNKDEKCGEYVELYAPDLVNEGEDLILKAIKLDNTEIEDFLWAFPDMTDYNFLTEGMVSSDDNPQFKITNFNFRDIGAYYLKMYPKKEGCSPIIQTKTIAMKPKTCDCPEPAQENVLYYSPSYEGQFSEDPVTIIVNNSNSNNSQSTITLQGTNTFTIFFGRQLPDVSCTYTIAGGSYLYWDDNLNKYSDTHVHLYGHNHALQYFNVEDMSEQMYFERTDNQLIIRFCDLELDNFSTPQFKLSGRFVINL